MTSFGGTRSFSRIALVVALCASGVNLVLWIIGPYRSPEADILDRVVQPLRTADTHADHIVIVHIDDDAFVSVFGSISPLRPEPMQQVLGAIRMFRPRLLVVDLFTDHWPSDVPPLVATEVPVIWAAEVRSVPEGFRLGGALPIGGDTARGLCVGIPSLFPDSDHVVRRQQPVLETADFGSRPTLAHAAARVRSTRRPDWYEQGCRLESEESRAGAPTRIRFWGPEHSFKRLNASSVLTGANEQRSSGTRWPLADEIEGKTVILAGTFAAARDRHLTPRGELDGAEVLAHAIQTLQEPGTERSRWTLLAIEIGLGFAALWLLTIVGPRRWRTVLSLALPLLLAIPVCEFVLGYFSTLPMVALSLVGIPLAHASSLWRAQSGERNERARPHVDLAASRTKDPATSSSHILTPTSGAPGKDFN